MFEKRKKVWSYLEGGGKIEAKKNLKQGGHPQM